MQDFQDAIDRVIGGLEKKNKIILRKRKDRAFHEAVMLLLDGSWSTPILGK